MKINFSKNLDEAKYRYDTEMLVNQFYPLRDNETGGEAGSLILDIERKTEDGTSETDDRPETDDISEAVSLYEADRISGTDMISVFLLHEKDGGDAELLFKAEKVYSLSVIQGAEIRTGQSLIDGGNNTAQTRDFIDAGTEIRVLKDIIKQLVYRVLCEHTGKELPWGILTGIRPTKLAMAVLERRGAGEAETCTVDNGYEESAESEIASLFRNHYYVSKEKTALAIAIAKREREILKDIDYADGYSLYIGIPFCPSTCLYCSFTSYPIGAYQDMTDKYADCLIKELEFGGRMFRDKKLNTIYLGGGTPTSLSAGQMDRILTAAEEYYDFSYLREYTVEAGRPDSITEEKLRVLKNHGITRISVNPQTMKQETLDLIGRRHTVQQTVEAFELARRLGFDNINMDLIVGLPNENTDDIRNTMERLTLLKPDSVTVHSLAIKRASRLNMFKEMYRELTIENNEQIMRMCRDYAQKMNMSPYYLYRQKNMAGNMENVGYAADGKAGIYNILIMEEKQTILALGAGSITKRVYPEGRIERCDNVKDVALYIEKIDEMIERKRKLFGNASRNI